MMHAINEGKRMSDKVISFEAAHQQRHRIEQDAAFERLSKAGARQAVLAAGIRAMRDCGSSTEEIVKMLRFAVDVLEGRE